MSDDKDRGTTAANQKGPTAEPFEVGISSNVAAELAKKANPEIVRRIQKHIDSKKS
jgi:hypothetical protein